MMGIINLYMRYFRKFQRNGILRRKLVMKNEKELEYRMSQKMFNEILSNRTEEEKKMNPYSFVADVINSQYGLRGKVVKISTYNS